MEHLWFVPSALECQIGESCVRTNATAGTPSVVPASLLRVAHACLRPRTLDQHSAALAEAGLASLGDSRALLSALRDAGLLKNLGALVSPLLTRPKQSAPIQAIGIPTANRPAMLARLLGSLAHSSQAQPRLIVVDSSSTADGQNRAREAFLANRAKLHPESMFVGPSEADRLLRRLSVTRILGERASSRLWRGTAGANRNMLLLLAAGQNILMMDDDIVANVWQPVGRQEGLVVGGHQDSLQWSFYRRRDDVHLAVAPSRENLAGVHAEVLGRSLVTLAEQESLTDWEGTCPHILALLARGYDPVVRVCMSGIAGDSGLASPYSLLKHTGLLRHSLLASPASFETAMESREVVRAARSLVVCHSSVCMAGCTSVLNASMVPPFGHIGRNEDGLFGALVSLTMPDSLFAHVPIGVYHFPPEQATRERPTVSEATAARFADVVIALIHLHGCRTPFGSSSDRIRWIGEVLLALSHEPPNVFREIVQEAVLSIRTAEARIFLDLLQEAGSLRNAVEPAVTGWFEAFFEATGRVSCVEPAECRDGGGGGLREEVAAFATLLIHWGELQLAARDVARLS